MSGKTIHFRRAALANVTPLRPIKVLLDGRDRRYARAMQFLLAGRGYDVKRCTTPAKLLAGVSAASRDDMRKVGERLLDLGASAVLVKGGHLESGGADDLFFDGTREDWLESERLPTRHTHGTGCVLSAAIAAELARGAQLLDAVRSGKAFVTEAIRHALAIGSGIGPVDPLWRNRRQA